VEVGDPFCRAGNLTVMASYGERERRREVTTLDYVSGRFAWFSVVQAPLLCGEAVGPTRVAGAH
jgi:hypothetical protein